MRALLSEQTRAIEKNCGPQGGVTALLSPLTLEQFGERYLSQSFVHIPGHAKRFEDLFCWEDLNKILFFHRAGVSHVRMYRTGERIPNESFFSAREHVGLVLNPARAQQELRDGATLVVDAVDSLHEPACELGDAVERAFYCTSRINLYANWRTSNGFDLHWDDHDVFILQVIGRKHWEIYNRTFPFPLTSDRGKVTAKPSGEPIWQGQLNAGDVLYLPRGWWHLATPCDEPTVHLTVSMVFPKAVEILEWLGTQLTEKECFRRDLHWGGSLYERAEAQREIQNALVDTIQGLLSRICGLILVPGVVLSCDTRLFP